LAVGVRGVLCVYDAGAGRVVQRLLEDDLVVAAAFGEDVFAAATDSKRVVTWSISGDNQFRQIGEHLMPKRVSALRILRPSKDVLVADKTGDLRRLPSAVDGGSPVTVKDAEEGGTEPLLGHFSVLTDVDVDVGGKLVATSDRDNKIRVSRLPDAFVAEAFLLGHEDSVARVHFVERDQTRLVSSSLDGSIRLWDVREGRVLDKYQLAGSQFVSGLVGCDGDMFAVVHGAPCVLLFREVGSEAMLGRSTEFALDHPATGMAVSRDRRIWVSVRAESTAPVAVYNIEHGTFQRDGGAEQQLTSALKDVGTDGVEDGIATGDSLALQRKKEMVDDWKGKKRRVDASSTRLLR